MTASLITPLCLLLPILVTSQNAKPCDETQCKIVDNCRCSSTENPITSENPGLTPLQLISITISEPISQEDYITYWKPLFSDLQNPDGSPVGVTFFVSHEFTDYAIVHDLYVQGHEIGVYSLTNYQNANYWSSANQTDLEAEFGGQRTIISTFANVPLDDITGVRTPLLLLQGDVTFTAYVASGFTYDNSWPDHDLFLPYTLDYESTQDINMIPFSNYPVVSYPHFWMLPIVIIKGNKAECQGNLLETCYEGSALDIAEWLFAETVGVRGAPLTLRLSSKWFRNVEHSFQGFRLFLERVLSFDNNFIVTGQDILEWIHNPTTAENYKRPSRNREKNCLDLICPLEFGESQRFMKSCVPCPEEYPWKGNPSGRKIVIV